jgi:hypothetical protein
MPPVLVVQLFATRTIGLSSEGHSEPSGKKCPSAASAVRRAFFIGTRLPRSPPSGARTSSLLESVVRSRESPGIRKSAGFPPIGVEDDGGQVQMVRQLTQEPFAVVVAPRNVRPAVAAAGDMVDGIGKINPRWSRHDYELPYPIPSGNSQS